MMEVPIIQEEPPCYHIETSPLICSATKWTGFYMIEISVMKQLLCRFYERTSMSKWIQEFLKGLKQTYDESPPPKKM